ncbi:TPA: division/cell wall cluster transcriptional repressor MraZ [candidate division WWE3 bacterium]|uniref:Transcriptional regulator MraZ n=4 Tax=Katanobacteria TaxID=422282 RepID=A0A0G1NKK0_UNCKA|nr:MAG: Protein MraZ [candidate division WWE3 bacterium GW2011_GWC2_44_9]HAZ29220.1 division/cell wall cluster transcriptional repressor MraZ [candidate division WWE3 bacterium]
MKMFLGEYQPNITEGNRIALPKKLRDQIAGNEIILSKGFEACVFVYAREDWEREWEKQVDNSIADPKTRQLKRYVFSGAADAVLDDQGRVVVPQSLKSYAGLEKEVVIIGAGDHMELWAKKVWDEHIAKISGELAA